jgi:ribose 5-phosphate isomerase B
MAAIPTESEVRALVSRVVAGLEPETAPATSSSPAPAAASGAATSGTLPAIAVGADHGGYPLKERIGFRLKELGHEVVDCGTHSADAVDYPDFAHAVAQTVVRGEATYGVIVDGAGIGSAMVANKVPGIRAALCYDISSARNSREHNHANVLTLGAGLVGASLALQIVEAWLATPWAEGRHANRVAKITDVEQLYVSSGYTRSAS